MKKIFLCLYALLFCAATAGAADLYDLRVIPGRQTGTIEFAGVIAAGRTRTDATGKRARFSGLLAEWLASGTVTIDSAQQQVSADVRDGEFSGQIKVASQASFTLSICHNGMQIHQESFLFPEKPDYLIISDIDDTILVTNVTSRIRMAYNSMFKRMERREAVSGTPELYRSLGKNIPPHGTPHFVYLSSSPAFLSRSIKAFLRRHEFPQGTVILKKSLGSGGHQHHKSGWLKQLMERFPGMPMLLIGDSGEQDPLIYKEFVEKTARPGQVKAIIIHEVTGDPGRRQLLAQMQSLLQQAKVPFIFWEKIEDLQEELQQRSLLPFPADH